MKTFAEEVKKLTAVPKDFEDDIREILYDYALKVAGLSNYVIDNDTIDSIKEIVLQRIDSCPRQCLHPNVGEDSRALVIKVSDIHRAFGLEK